jgi:phosphoglycerate dehydrogenase-like enzyme
MEPLTSPLRVATLDVALPHQGRLSKLLDFPHEFVAASGTLQKVDAVVALRFGTEQAQRFSTRLLHLPGAGADAVDFSSLTRGCEVCNVFEHEIPIAEYVLTAILSHTIAYQPMQAAFDADHWKDSYAARRMHGEVSGRTVGLVGFGHIGRAVTQRAKAFGMCVHAISNSGTAPGADWAGNPSQLAQMLPLVDFLVMACPLTPQTRGMLGAQQLTLLKPTAIVINIGRAQLIDEEALYLALSGGKLAGATLDVWYDYPTPERPDARPSRFPFEKLTNVHCTAHSCAWTPGLLERRYLLIADNLARLYRGAPLRNVIFTAP